MLEHPTRTAVLDLLTADRRTAREISRRLHQRESVVGYHCRRLVKAGAVEVVEVEKRRGVEAKILRPTPLGLYAREWV